MPNHSDIHSDLMIDVRDVAKTYVTRSETVEAIQTVSLQVRRGEFVAILGPSGCGKSTLMLIIATARRLPMFDRAVRGNDFAIQSRYELLGRELDGLSLGVVGYGRIGRRVAEMCEAAFRMRIHVYDPYVEPGRIELDGRVAEASLVDMAAKVEGIEFIYLEERDVVRHKLVKDIIRAFDAREKKSK